MNTEYVAHLIGHPHIRYLVTEERPGWYTLTSLSKHASMTLVSAQWLARHTTPVEVGHGTHQQ